MPACAIIGCSQRYHSSGEIVRLFDLPTIILNQCPKTIELSTKRRLLWLSRINRKWDRRELSNGTVKVCQRHFVNGEPSMLFDFSHPDWAPTLDLGYDFEEKNSNETAFVVPYIGTTAQRPNKSIVPPSVANKIGTNGADDAAPSRGTTGTAQGKSFGSPILQNKLSGLKFLITDQRSAELPWEQLNQEEVVIEEVSTVPESDGNKLEDEHFEPDCLITKRATRLGEQPSREEVVLRHVIEEPSASRQRLQPSPQPNPIDGNVAGTSGKTALPTKEPSLKDAVPDQKLPDLSDVLSELSSTTSSYADGPFLSCSAPNCNYTEETHSVFMFPTQPKKRKAWLKNCNLDVTDTDSPLSLCEIHFENDQFQKRTHRKMLVGDHRRFLKSTAVPTIFPNGLKKPDEVQLDPSNTHSTPRLYSPINLVETCSTDGSPHSSPVHSSAASPTPRKFEERSTADLLKEISHLKHRLNKMEQMLKTFLTDEQIEVLTNACRGDEPENFTWGSESIPLGLKFQFNLGTHGYNFLRSTNYALPDIETLKTGLENTVISFGVFEDLSELLELKVQALDPLDRLCTISLGQMKLNDLKHIDKSKRRLITDTKAGGHISIVLIKGLRSCWEQIIACESIAPSVDGMSQRLLLEKSLSFAEECGLRVLSVSSDLSSESRLMWSAFGVDVTKSESERSTHFNFNDHEIHVVPDVCHLLKSLKAEVDKGILLPAFLVESETLPTAYVSSKYVKELWDCEAMKQPASRMLHHLLEKDMEPGATGQISLESTLQFFSAKTARALECAVMSEKIPSNALSTAYFCRLIEQWISICDSNAPINGISIDNKQTIFDFLGRFIHICQGIQIGDGWSPINSGLILSTISLCEVSSILLEQEGFGDILLHRFSQDALEKVISQMSELSSSTDPVFSVQCLRMLKTITINQLISDVDRSCYSVPSVNWVKTSSTTSSIPMTNGCKPPKRVRRATQKMSEYNPPKRKPKGTKKVANESKPTKKKLKSTKNLTTESKKPTKQKRKGIKRKGASVEPKSEFPQPKLKKIKRSKK